MPNVPLANHDQAARWNDQSGRTWTELRDLIDGVLAPFIPLIVHEIDPIGGGDVLDVGCGAGALTLATAKLAGPTGSCLGVDISAPLIAAAKARAEHEGVSVASFREADAQVHPFDCGGFDAIVSRFGVMFFEDPAAAFRNLRRAARADAKLVCMAWRSPAENGFMTAAAQVAAAALPDFPPQTQDGPGQFGFADDAFVRTILAESGWQTIAIRAIDVPCHMPRRDLMTYAIRMGPLGAVFPLLDDKAKAELAPKIEAAFDPFVQGEEVHFIAACWMITARA